jgi:hypothetical protein
VLENKKPQRKTRSKRKPKSPRIKIRQTQPAKNKRRLKRMKQHTPKTCVECGKLEQDKNVIVDGVKYFVCSERNWEINPELVMQEPGVCGQE